MKFVTYNIQYGKGKDGTFDLDRIAAAVHGADVIALQEVSRYMPMVEAEDQPARLAELLPEYYWVYGPALDVDGSDKAIDGKVNNKRIQFGNILMSRSPITTFLVYALPKQSLVDRRSDQRIALEGTINTDAGMLRLYSVHLSPNNPRERMLQVEALLAIHQQGRNGRRIWSGSGGWFERSGQVDPGPAPEAVVMGDFNLEPDAEPYTLMVGQVDPVYGRISAAENFVDSWVRAGKSESSGVTCPRCLENDTLHDMRIDYGFVSTGLAGLVSAAWIDSGAQGSDHQPVWFELEMDP